jgi:hypothetical protein
MYTSRRRRDAEDGTVTTIARGGVWPQRWAWDAEVTRGEMTTSLSGGALTRRGAERKMAEAIASVEVHVADR